MRRSDAKVQLRLSPIARFHCVWFAPSTGVTRRSLAASLVLRIGTGGAIVDRADVEARMSKWTNTYDPRIVRPMPDTTNDECSRSEEDFP